MDHVIRIPKEDPVPLSKKHSSHSRKRGASARVKSEQVADEEGVDDMTDPDGIVWSWEGNCEALRRTFSARALGTLQTDEAPTKGVAFTEKMMNPVPTQAGKFSFQKIYTELDYLAGGILQIPAGQQKPMKAAKDNSYVRFSQATVWLLRR